MKPGHELSGFPQLENRDNGWQSGCTIHPTEKHRHASEAQPRMSQPAFQTSQQSSIYQPEASINPIQTAEEKAEEARRIRRLQLMMHMVMQVIQQDRSLPVEQASEMVADARRAALAMFPEKELAFDLIFWPRLQRLMRERYRMQ
jgi:hypothetical protein